MGELKLAPQQRRIIHTLGQKPMWERDELCDELSKARAIPMTIENLAAHIWKLRKKGCRVMCKTFYFLG